MTMSGRPTDPLNKGNVQATDLTLVSDRDVGDVQDMFADDALNLTVFKILTDRCNVIHSVGQ